MTPEEARELNKLVLRMVEERSNLGITPDFMEQLKARLTGEYEDENFPEFKRLQDAFSLLSINALVVSQNDVNALFERISALIGTEVEGVEFINTVTERPFSFNELQELDQDEIRLRRVLEDLNSDLNDRFDNDPNKKRFR